MLLVLVLTLFAAATFSGCQPEWIGPAATLPARSMKGYELYSWQEMGEWHFALLLGTNRIKTYHEVTSPDVRVKDIEVLKSELDRLSVGEQVFWLVGRVPGMALPAEAVIDELRVYCEGRGIRLEVTDLRPE